MMDHLHKVLGAGLTLALAGCGGSTTGASANGPSIQATPGLIFTPSVLTATAGVPVSFVFGTTGHTVVFDGGNGKPEDITTVTSSKTVVRTFSTPGDFPYHCTVHPQMTGSVHVTTAPVTGAY